MKSLKIPFYIIVLFIVQYCLNSCGKNKADTNGGYYLNFKVNGEKVSCNKNLQVTLDSNRAAGLYILNISGQSDTCNIGIVLETTKPVLENIIYGDSVTTKVLNLSYSGLNGQVYQSAGDSVAMTRIQFTMITPDVIQGTFSGNTIDYINNPDSRSITEGSFYLPLP